MNEKINDLLTDAAFTEAFLTAEDVDAVKGLFAGKGVALDAETLTNLAEAVADIVNRLSQDGELSEGALENVAGGNMPIYRLPDPSQEMLIRMLPRCIGDRPDRRIMPADIRWLKGAGYVPHGRLVQPIIPPMQ
ncbi:MAG: hypothetical protein IKN55_12095 [Oscillospiraceae bacterium]|nr:hypothetical protein [Oscillospiraceae bacterium]